MNKVKYSYAIVQSMFGNMWVGKSKRKADGKQYFETHQKAINLAMLRFEEKHGLYDFDPDDEGIHYDILEEYEAIQSEDGDIQEIDKKLEQFVMGK